MSSLLMPLAVFTTGLYAGFMLTFLIAVMPGLAMLPDDQFNTAMRRFNEKVPRAIFLILFFGVIALPAAVLLVGIGEAGSTEQVLVLIALICAIGSHLVTAIGNVPLNNALANANANAGSGTGTDEDSAAVRAAFESRWNTLHQARTALSLIGFALLIAASA